MENTDKYLLRFYIALFSSVISHSVIILLIITVFPSIELQRKTIPFQLIANDRKGFLSNPSNLSRSENALAAQEFLRTLNESSFEQLIKRNTQDSLKSEQAPSPFKQENISEHIFLKQSIPQQNNQSANALQGLQDIFSNKTPKPSPSKNTQQISTKSLEQLTSYEISLLQKLARNELYDNFHSVMAKNQQSQIEYIISLHLFPNGAIRNASIIESSNIEEIDQLAIKVAYAASPFPKPPTDDISKNFRYDIPIIYKKNEN